MGELNDFTKDELLKFAIDNGMLDLSYVADEMEMSKRKELLEKHQYKVWQGTDGYWNTYIPCEDGNRKRIKKKIKKQLEDCIIEYLSEVYDNPTIEDVFNEWNERRLSIGKICPPTYERNQQIFNRHYEKVRKKKMKKLEPEFFSDFLEEEIFRLNLTSKAYGNLKSVTKGFLSRAKKRKLISWNIEDMFETLDVTDHDFKKVIKEDYEEVFDDLELPRLLRHLTEEFDMVNAAVLIMVLTGIRVGELVTLKHSDFDGYTFKVRRTETRIRSESGKYEYHIKEYPKTPAGVRQQIVPKDYWWVLKKLENFNYGGEYIFVRNGKRITTNVVRRRMVRICDNLQIYRKSPHKARKTYGSILLDNNIDNNMVTSLMGHVNISTTEINYHRNRKQIEKKAEIISGIEEFKMAK